VRFSSPIPLLLAIGLLIGVWVVWLVRKPAMPRATAWLILVGSLLLALAAGGPWVNLPCKGKVIVMIDRSASTRTAGFRDARILSRRLNQLLGSTPYTQIDFGDDGSDHTTFSPPADAQAIVLFSDAQLELPATAPTTYIVEDASLEHPADAAVVSLESNADVIATVRNGGPPRELMLGRSPTTVPSGTQVITSAIEQTKTTITARFAPGDAWPENDALSLNLPPPRLLQRWWVTTNPSPPSSSWRSITPVELASDVQPYLSTSVIVLDDLPADALRATQQDRLAQFVRDLGGGVVILGGEHAFGAGGYDGSTIDSLSPLASSPPTPQRQWIILVDSSGSMASPVADPAATRWQRATTAATQLIAHLPPNDNVSIGSFARDLRWWSQAKSASETVKLSLPPSDITAGGPTNLGPVLQGIGAQLDPSTATQIIVISDADTTIDDPPALASRFTSKNAKLNLLATADTSHSPLPGLVALTGGQVTTQLDPRLWSDAAKELARSAAPQHAQHTPLSIQYKSSELALPPHSVTTWIRTWLKRDATQLASAAMNDEAIPLAARWHVGSGQVAAAAFAPSSEEAEALANLVARPPRDPRYALAWKVGARLVVTVDARDGDRYLNDLNLAMDISDATGGGAARKSFTFSQTGPGRYEVTLSAPRASVLASVREADHVIDRFAVAGRYAPEFDAIGNDHAAMRALAERTGGAVIEPPQTRPIDFAWPKRSVSITSLMACCGAALIGLGLIRWKVT
jgi:hypothetical protein